MSLGPRSEPSRDLARSLPRAAGVIAAGRARGLHLGAQVYVSRRGEVVADGALGEIRPGEPLTADALMLWLSASKPLTAVAVAVLWERGLLTLDDPIALHVPAFAAGGKEGITLRHALTHTGGFRMLATGWPGLSWDEVIAKVCATRREPRWEPGKTAGYHQAGSWFILGEILRRLSGRSFPDFLRDAVLTPCGMEASHLGMTGELYRTLEPLLAPSYDTSDGKSEDLGWHSELHSTRPSPAGGGRGPVRDLGRFYEMLLRGGVGPGGRVITPQTVEALTARHRVGLYDKTFRHVMDWGLGLIPDPKLHDGGAPYAYGGHCSARTVGHSGYRSTTAFADPEHGLAVAVAFNGLPAPEVHAERMRSTLEAIYEDLGLAS